MAHPMTTRHRTTWTTCQVRASDVNLNDTVMHEGSAWQVMEGEAFGEDGQTLTVDRGPAAVVEVNLVRAAAPPSATASTPSGTPLPTVLHYRRRLLLTPDDLVTIQAPAGLVDVDAGLGRSRTPGLG